MIRTKIICVFKGDMGISRLCSFSLSLSLSPPPSVPVHFCLEFHLWQLDTFVRTRGSQRFWWLTLRQIDAQWQADAKSIAILHLYCFLKSIFSHILIFLLFPQVVAMIFVVSLPYRKIELNLPPYRYNLLTYMCHKSEWFTLTLFSTFFYMCVVDFVWVCCMYYLCAHVCGEM